MKCRCCDGSGLWDRQWMVLCRRCFGSGEVPFSIWLYDLLREIRRTGLLRWIRWRFGGGRF